MRNVLLCALVVAIPATGRADAPIPLRDFFKNPQKTGFSLSPDGKWLAYRAPHAHRLNVFVQPTAGGAARRITSERSRGGVLEG